MHQANVLLQTICRKYLTIYIGVNLAIMENIVFQIVFCAALGIMILSFHFIDWIE